MSTWNTVTLTPAEGQPALTEAEIEQWYKAIVGDKLNDMTFDSGETAVFTGGSKWSEPEIDTLCIQYTIVHPGATAEWHEEWDNRDADEAGQEVTAYKNGEIDQAASKTGGLIPANLAELLKDATEALDQHKRGGAATPADMLADPLRALVAALA